MAASIEIKWNTLDISQWEERFNRLPYSNFLQSYSYAKAYCPHARQKARWGLVMIDGREAGLLQIFEACLFFKAFHAVMVDRGPLWFEGFGNAMHIKRVFEELNRQFPPRFGCKRRILPEVEDGQSIRKMLGQLGLQRLEREGYQTLWLDLQKSDEDILTGMNANTRNNILQSGSADLSIEWDVAGTHAPWMTGVYAADKALHKYGGPSPQFLQKYIPHLVKDGNYALGRAVSKGQPVAFVLFVKHGRSATYLAGWSEKDGQVSLAHHLLFWQGIKMLKEQGIKELDLGDVNNDNAKGIKEFKEGLGGRVVRHVGHYI